MVLKQKGHREVATTRERGSALIGGTLDKLRFMVLGGKASYLHFPLSLN